MKQLLTLLVIVSLPAFAQASGGHAHNHDDLQAKQNTHDMSAESHGGHENTMDNSMDNSMGQPGEASSVKRVVDITMNDDMRFTPQEIRVNAGETIRFFIKNAGKLNHEMVIGSREELQEHAAMMRNMPGMQHAEPNMIALAAGQRGAIVWQFEKAGTVDFACLVPGHMEAGMTGKIRVE